jgi:hypothetical protein
MKPFLIYDIEIEKAILGRNETKIEGIQYCDGWNDHAGMGISCLCCYDYGTGKYRVFTASNKDQFAQLCQERIIVGFNSRNFDNKVLKAVWDIIPADSMDILLGIQETTGTFKGYGLDACCEANFGIKKTGHGALAPVDWQQGKIGDVIDYCLSDVYMTKRLFDMIRTVGGIRSPLDAGAFIPVNIKRMVF